MRQLKLDIQDQNDFINVADTLEKLSAIGKDAEISLHISKKSTQWLPLACSKNAKSLKSHAPQGKSHCLDLKNDRATKKKIFSCIP